jgi:GH35 family endo-1,4-beta-xylanase
MLRFDEARSSFSAALTSPQTDSTYDLEHARLAREALTRAIEASEMLSTLQAERQLTARLNPDADARPLSSPRVGTIVHNDQFSEPLKRVVATHFDFITSPMRWRDIEKEEGKFSFGETDRWIEWAVRSGKVSLIGGPVLDFSPRAVPGWLYIWEHDYSSLREFAYEHAKRVVTRYRRTISRWSVISGVNLNEGFAFSIDQMLELTRLAVLLVRKLHPSAKVVVDLTQPFGEHASTNAQSVAPLLYAELVMESGIQIDAFGLRLQFGDRAPGRSTRDLMQLSAILDTYSVFEKPIDITAIGVPSEPIPAPPDEKEDLDPGRWHADWSLELQSEWMTDALTIAMGKPFVRSFCWQALFDTADGPEMPGGGLITTDGRAKPVLKRIGEGRRALRSKQLPKDAKDSPDEPTPTPAAKTDDD